MRGAVVASVPLLLGGWLGLMSLGAAAAGGALDRGASNPDGRGDVAPPPSRADDAGHAWPQSLRALRVSDLPLPDRAAEKAAWSRDRRIDPALLALSDAVGRKGVGSLDAIARELGIPFEDRRVLVRLAAESPDDRQRIERDVEKLGGEVTATFEESVMARIPASAMDRLPEVDGMAYAAPQAVFAPAYEERLEPARPGGATVSEGVASIGADRLHQAGITGKGVKVGIIDFGYRRYAELRAAGEVPRPAAARAFNGSGQLESDTVHGTACAEIVHDMAPDAMLYLAAVDGRDDEIINAANWLAGQGVDLISFSGGGHHGPRNGRALLDRFVDDMTRKRGIPWIVAAGNDGASHWLGKTIDADRDGLIDVDNPGTPLDALLLQVPRETNVTVRVYWDDWGPNPAVPAASQDLDAHLFALTPQGVKRFASSAQPQNGRGSPIEYLDAKLPAGDYVLALEARRLGRPVNVHVVAKGKGARLLPLDPAGSVTIPASAHGAFAVGAVDVRNGEGESFSGRGPTDDGRLKPQVTAPNQNLSVAYREQGGRFPGTSAACPHVSGFAALLKQRQPGLSPSDLYRELMAQVRPLGPRVPNAQYGHGHIDATRVAINDGVNDGVAPPRPEPSPSPETSRAARDLADIIREHLGGGDDSHPRKSP